MRRSAIGSSDIEASVIGLGSWPLTGWLWGGMDPKEAHSIIDAALSSEINLIDTAPVYGLGAAERIVGDAIKGKRSDVVVVSKCGLSWESKTGSLFAELGGSEVFLDLSPAAIRRDLEGSLKRLGTDYIDVYMPHWPDANTPVVDTMGALQDLKTEGKIRAIGASNIDPPALSDYASHICCAQLLYNLIDRGVDTNFSSRCAKADVEIMAHSVLAQGLLAATMAADREFPDDDLRAGSPRFSEENRRKMLAFAKELKPMADSLGTDVGTLIVAWTLHQPGVGRVLCGARSAAQARWNAKAGSLMLNADQISFIEERFALSGVQ